MNSFTGGDVLYATVALDGSYFENALILIVDNNKDGLFGLILNRPSHMPIKELFNGIHGAPGDHRTIYSGGPVDEDMVLTLRIGINRPSGSDSKLIGDSIEYGTHWHSVDDLLTTTEEDVQIYLGYVGWRERQLDDEIREESWTLYKGIDSLQLLRSLDSTQLMERAEILSLLIKLVGEK